MQRRVPPAGVPAARTLRHWARLALAGHEGELTIRIVGEREMAELNGQWRGRDYPTNVLSFAYDTPGLIGDVVICAAVVAREAREQGKAPRAHWAHMVVHGCLHLIGYDHEREDDAARMEAAERALLAELGFPDPYRM